MKKSLVFNFFFWGALALTVLGFYLPRMLKEYGGEGHFLSSYIYIYLLGGLIFALNLYGLVKTKAFHLKREGEKKWLCFFILGFLTTMSFHGIWIAFSVLIPFKGLL